MKKLLLVAGIIVTIPLSGAEITRAFFGDKEKNQVVVVNVEEMKFADPGRVDTDHQITYTADKVFDHPKVYVVNRGSNALDIINVNTIELTENSPILLEHFPRSAESMNETLRLNETSGMDKPMASIIDIDTDEVIATMGEDEEVDPDYNPNHGGSHATGHPFWLDAHHFVILDRYKRKVITYRIEKDSKGKKNCKGKKNNKGKKNCKGKWNIKKLNEVATTTSIHQIIPSKGNYAGNPKTFYATAEGSDDKYPSIIEFKLTPNKGLKKKRELPLKAKGYTAAQMGLHHGDFHPTEKLIYVGSTEGTLFVVDYRKMKVVKTIQAGRGAGHTVMIPQKNLAVVINHKDTFVTIVNTETNTKIKDVYVSTHKDWVGNKTIQAHPKYHVSKDSKYFYAFLTEEGSMYRLDLNSLDDANPSITHLPVGGKPAQGSFVKVTVPE